MPVLIVIEGEEIPYTHVLEHGETVIGRDPTCNIRIADGRCSRRHARLTTTPAPAGVNPTVRIEDLRSTNGTCVNDERLTEVRPLHEHDHIRIGSTVLGFAYRDPREIRAQRRLEELAATDVLTGLINRRVFDEELKRETGRAQRYGRPMSLLVLDLDHFKNINDTWGHPMGDQVLCELTSTLRRQLRRCDIAGRIGGEEFGVILPETGDAGAIVAAERIRMAVSQHTMLAAHATLHLTVSIGAATLTAGISEPETLLAAADRAMYEAKAAGRNRCRAWDRALPPA